jgi:hypothetical protein
MLAAEQLGEFDQRDVHLGLDRGQDHVAIGLNVMRAKITTLRQGRHPAVDAPGADPTNGSRNRDPETLGRRIAGHAVGNDGDQPRAKILG